MLRIVLFRHPNIAGVIKYNFDRFDHLLSLSCLHSVFARIDQETTGLNVWPSLVQR